MEYNKIIYLSLQLTVIFGFAISFKPEDAKIYGGVKADPEAFPYQVSIRYLEGTNSKFSYNEHLCAGSILSEHYVLTAAHCFHDLNEDGYKIQDVHKVRVVAGQVNLELTDESIYRDTDHFIIHPDFEEHLLYLVNDIVIIRVEEPFDLTHPYISQVDLAIWNNEVTNCFVSGWGKTEKVRISEVLLYTTVNIIPLEKCLESYIEIPIYARGGMLCTGWSDDNKHDSCKRDSGGPLICDQQQVGVVSFGEGCADSKYPGVYMNVPHFYEWIQETINKSNIRGEL